MQSAGYPRIYLYKRIVQAKLFIDAHFAERIDLNNISDEACFSKFHFVRLFKKIYGRPPHQYLVHVRVENAKKLLQGNIQVSTACYAVGFESVGTFSALFKRMTGMTPSAYQTQQQLRHAELQQRPFKFIPNCFANQYGWREKSNFEEMV